MHYQIELALSLLAALALGLMIGIERGWSGRDSDEGTRGCRRTNLQPNRS